MLPSEHGGVAHYLLLLCARGFTCPRVCSASGCVTARPIWPGKELTTKYARVSVFAKVVNRNVAQRRPPAPARCLPKHTCSRFPSSLAFSIACRVHAPQDTTATARLGVSPLDPLAEDQVLPFPARTTCARTVLNQVGRGLDPGTASMASCGMQRKA